MSQLALPALDRKAPSLPTAPQQTCDMENELGWLPSKSAKLCVLHFQREAPTCPFLLATQHHDDASSLDSGLQPAETAFVGCTEVLVKHSLLLLCSARWKHTAQGKAGAVAVVLSQCADLLYPSKALTHSSFKAAVLSLRQS